MTKTVTHICNKEAEISAIQTTLSLLEPNIEKVIKANMSSMRAILQANHDIQMLEFKAVKERQDRTNGRVEDLERTQRSYDNLAGEIIRNISPIIWVKKHPIKTVGVFLFLNLILIYVASTLSLETIISWIK